MTTSRSKLRGYLAIAAAGVALYALSSRIFTTSAADSGFVLGAANLTTVNAVPFVTASGKVTQDAANFNYNPGTQTLFATNLSGAISGLLHSIPITIDGGGSAISTGDVNRFPTAAFACTISRVDISADQSGSITIDVWKRAGAIPTGANKISASAPLTLSSSQLSQNGSLAGWTTAVSVGDVFGFTVATASGVTAITGQIWCQ